VRESMNEWIAERGWEKNVINITQSYESDGNESVCEMFAKKLTMKNCKSRMCTYVYMCEWVSKVEGDVFENLLLTIVAISSKKAVH
jgi:hypothetical protein